GTHGFAAGKHAGKSCSQGRSGKTQPVVESAPAGAGSGPQNGVRLKLWTFRLRGRFRAEFERGAGGGAGRARGSAPSELLSGFERSDSNRSTLTLKAKLPIVGENFTRTFRMANGENVIYVDSQLE